MKIIFFLFNFFFGIFYSDAISEETIQQSKFFEINYGRERNSKFGDVINLANGKLEMDQNGRFQLVEIRDNCIKYCLEESIDGHNITAFWSIYKIRHRDENRGYRYEWKITIRQQRNGRFDGKRSIDKTPGTRSFLVRDQDYPRYFETTVKQADSKLEKRLFSTHYDRSEHPFNLDYRAQPSQHERVVDNLNTGEYYAKDPSSSSTVKYQIHHTNGQLQADSANHVHHHYFLNKQEAPIFKTTHFEKVSTFPAHSVHQIHPVHELNSMNFPNHLRGSQISTPRIHNQLDSYGDAITTTSQAPVQFPDSIKFHDDIRPTTYRGHYDDNRESILEGEIKRNNFESTSNHNQLVSFPVRHANIIPVSHINTTPTSSSYSYNSYSQTSPAIHSHFDKQVLNPIQSPIHSHNQLYWLGQNPQTGFIPSFPFHENTFSELDPIYHSSFALSTPPALSQTHIPDINTDFHARYVSDLPLRNTGEDLSYDRPTETHQTTSTNTDPSYTTPFNIISTTKHGFGHKDIDESNSYPDSINAQLPPPESGIDVRVPYIETNKSKSRSTRKGYGKKGEKLKLQNDDASVSVDKSANVEEKTTKKSSLKYKSQRNISTTDKPQSYLPKRPRLRGTDKYKTMSEMMKMSTKKPNIINRRKIMTRKTPTTTTAEPYTVTTDFPDVTTEYDAATTTQIDEEPRTTQSVRKSVSVHISEKVTVVPKKISTKLVKSSKNSEMNKKLNRKAKIIKIEASDEDVGTDYLEQ